MEFVEEQLDAITVAEAAAPAAGAPSDRLLLRLLRGGSQEAAQELYRRYAGRLRALVRAQCATTLARQVDPDDIVQSVFDTFFHGASCGRYDIPDGEDLWKLFLVIGLNKIRAQRVFHLAAKRDARRTTQLGARSLASRRRGADHGSEGFLELVVQEALERLPPQHRVIVELRLAGHGVEEIARQTGRSIRSVERVLQESRTRLKWLFEVQ
jgi:RNA polymerase sigma-70 factor (ECF subfamily)